MRAAFIFPNPRGALLAGIAAGVEPDSTLLGANHLAELGIDPGVHDPCAALKPAMAKRIVATERAILRDYVDDGVDALLVPPEDPAALREAIVRVLSDRDLAERLGAAARARVEREHTTRGFAARLAPLLASVV